MDKTEIRCPKAKEVFNAEILMKLFVTDSAQLLQFASVKTQLQICVTMQNKGLFASLTPKPDKKGTKPQSQFSTACTMHWQMIREPLTYGIRKDCTLRQHHSNRASFTLFRSRRTVIAYCHVWFLVFHTGHLFMST